METTKTVIQSEGGKYCPPKSLTILGKVELKYDSRFDKSKSPSKAHFNQKPEKVRAKKFLIKVDSKGPKGSWWNKYVDNYFLVEIIEGKEEYTIIALSNFYGNVINTMDYNRLKLPVTHANKIMSK